MYVHVRGGQKNGSLVAKRRYFDDVPNAMFFLSTKPCQRPHSGLCCADQNPKLSVNVRKYSCLSLCLMLRVDDVLFKTS